MWLRHVLEEVLIHQLHVSAWTGAGLRAINLRGHMNTGASIGSRGGPCGASSCKTQNGMGHHHWVVDK